LENPRTTDDWLWRPFPSGESERPDGVSVAFVERLLKEGETLKALPIEKWSV
jgi:hypothetical protein